MYYDVNNRAEQKAANTARIATQLCNLQGWIQTLGWKPEEQIQHWGKHTSSESKGKR